MRCNSISITVLALATALVMSITTNAATPLILSHQGRLLDASDVPLSGSFTIIYSIHDLPVGGSQLWLEDHVGVLVTDGLFTVALGSTVPLTTEILAGSGGGGGGGGSVARYLQIQLSGQPPIMPRTQLLATPYAVASHSVSGDITTSPGKIDIKCTGCVATDGIRVVSGGDAESIQMQRLNGLPPGTPYIGNFTVSSSPTGSHLELGDIDADGELDMRCEPDSTVIDLSSSESGSLASSFRAKAGKTGSTKIMICHATNSSSQISEDCDDAAEMRMSSTGTDGDDCSTTMRCDPDSIVEKADVTDAGALVLTYKATTGKTGKARNVRFTKPGGGATETDEDCGGLGASWRAINTKGTGATVRYAADVSDVDAHVLLETDSDGDGVMENTCTLSSNDLSSSVVASSRFGSGPRQTTSMDGSFSHSRMRCDSDSDNDGVQDNSVISESSSSGASLRIISLNGLPPGEPVYDNIALHGDGSSSSVALKKGVAQVGLNVIGGALPGGSIISSRCVSSSGLDSSSTEQSSDGSTAAMRAINTKGTGATLRVASVANDSGTVATDCDDDDDGIFERATWTTSNPGVARSIVAADLDGDGAYDNTVMQSCDATSARIAMAGGTSLSGTSGAKMEASSTRSHVTLDKGDVEVGMETKDVSGSYEGSFTITVTSIKAPGLKVHLGSNGIGYLSDGLGVGVEVPTHKVDVVGGAYCDGSVWANASDKNAKENFEQIDGEELLGKIAELDITKWNYKGDDAAKHIGPTAQDFKRAFGVGSDDKSISTVDPSGIALAAIKELYAQLKSKDKELAELREEMAKMKKEIAKKN